MTEQYLVTVSGDTETTAEELADATRRLIAELREIEGVETSQVVLGSAPPGTRADASTLTGGVGLTVVGAMTARMVLGTITIWLTRNKDKTVTVRRTPDGGVQVTLTGYPDVDPIDLVRVAGPAVAAEPAPEPEPAGPVPSRPSGSD